jgi:DNA-binding NarL/FixJ family response regulator
MNTNVDVGSRGSETVAASLCRGAPSGAAPLEHGDTRHRRASSAVEQPDRELFGAGSANMNDSGERTAKIRILVADEQPLLRHGICAYLNSQPDMIVCGEAGSISDVRSKIAECHPQFVLTALRLGAEDSLKLIKELKTEDRTLRILVYSALEESIFAERAMRAGANGYVMKQVPTERLATAIRDVVHGGIYVSREVALSAFRKSLRRRRKNNRALRLATDLEKLSDREMHIFQLLIRNA